MSGRVARLLRVSLTVADLPAAAAFYCRALGFSAGAEEKVDAADRGLLGAGERAARRMTLRLGAQELELVAFDPPGRPYPAERSAADPWFQHVAIVVGDMAAAWARVRAAGGMPITTGGPQRLPPATGGVTAWKFRDKDGHPLELIGFPPGTGDPAWQRRAADTPCLGIDHSALVVRDAERSIAFYAATLGLSVAARTRNHGAEQARLDALAGAVADVVALSPAAATPHVELLAYRVPQVAAMTEPLASYDIAASRLVFDMQDAAGQRRDAGPALLHDPDMHAVVLIAPA